LLSGFSVSSLLSNIGLGSIEVFVWHGFLPILGRRSLFALPAPPAKDPSQARQNDFQSTIMEGSPNFGLAFFGMIFFRSLCPCQLDTLPMDDDVMVSPSPVKPPAADDKPQARSLS